MSYYDQVQSKIVPFDQIESKRKSLEGKRIVFTNGCFDILHPGHVSYLAQARDLGDILWIGVNEDASVRRLKGESRPINSCEDRMFVLAGLLSVDFVSSFAEDTPLEILKKVKPSVHSKGGDYQVETLPEYQILKEMGADIQILPFVSGKSTTKILEKAKSPS
ncbi:D-glycero-beta-D-manno-heptose 1-phosphate adenylyltransferase [Leptospira bandrabouensis]|uniref:D-glycero-beta-D-manno-heptose 1-phosphate adenylyltransferase n=1 Tax=Leptospira bandrabouensis TaxID=2484903 RepID=A0A6H3NL70_9LEPT|nr:D-glycero-beta-D-manno-heptose 1-phosphate adenylyltransferase [Leptospira bandrabouensis]MCG6145515.1 D-glycero-beta-D-manno-heptose 1-phosphate adenylyltransferase [Leptospira bandrabouensis]MCG6152546.1 D-glycero-beta-D-manno-heptose 1-phosphate adenylyltransferase [Leptospira bandrabouensis]MCG6161139.1 D-glycero-beta-D-manno-heptose 1-phosphate adenylyltransferase [Leptospira bandrabouensis]MCG6164737.1 D-glycero-beta-D-manno-heptose 1-phosphate adenylyltransferase [Leptospira bandrabou